MSWSVIRVYVFRKEDASIVKVIMKRKYLLVLKEGSSGVSETCSCNIPVYREQYLTFSFNVRNTHKVVGFFDFFLVRKITLFRLMNTK